MAVSLQIYYNLPACILHWKEWTFVVTLYPLSLQISPPQIYGIGETQKRTHVT